MVHTFIGMFKTINRVEYYLKFITFQRKLGSHESQITHSFKGNVSKLALTSGGEKCAIFSLQGEIQRLLKKKLA